MSLTPSHPRVVSPALGASIKLTPSVSISHRSCPRPAHRHRSHHQHRKCLRQLAHRPLLCIHCRSRCRRSHRRRRACHLAAFLPRPPHHKPHKLVGLDIRWSLDPHTKREPQPRCCCSARCHRRPLAARFTRRQRLGRLAVDQGMDSQGEDKGGHLCQLEPRWKVPRCRRGMLQPSIGPPLPLTFV
jgi:hypothetical protein